MYFDLNGMLPFVWFNSHSAVESPDGELFDITPPSNPISQEYPFIRAHETEEEYAALVEGDGVGRIEHYK